MNKKARRAALLARMASAQLEPVRSFDANCMVRISGCQSVLEVLQSIKHGGPQWAHRYVTVWFSNPANAWVQVYCSQDGSAPYFDVMYTRKEPPQEALSLVLARYPQCDVIDWSPGRLACIRAQDVDIETLAEVIRHVAEAAWGERLAFAGASYEEMGRA
ncbi:MULTISPECIES: hypothetical protein [Variovorax]|nr:MULTISPECIES: hypothetical protein [Variovorax]ODU13643.1 MAG: hypothetical protein ABS94_26045 [Variovorax sp. SCN 67-85]ODV20945.1 MAG: hypothetical protein ABT25_24500 [Variovorax sp. SCN 67-20]OJZ08134.1 MAG: hypothetical protein BGP22_03595 [Variovorax sp. 67-131]UKI05645.1 hypothetical protein L3V85_22780 [Variovorax paradoxus]